MYAPRLLMGVLVFLDRGRYAEAQQRQERAANQTVRKNTEHNHARPQSKQWHTHMVWAKIMQVYQGL